MEDILNNQELIVGGKLSNWAIKEINELVEQGYIRKVIQYGLTLYNYTEKCQYEKKWNPITLMCRGLIVDQDNKIVARPFDKFFNYEEVKDTFNFNQKFKTYEKLDGSLGIVYFTRDYNESDDYTAPRVNIATRGSFNSDQAVYAKDKLFESYTLNLRNLKLDYTYLFEIIYPANRIVLDYKQEERLVMLGARNNATGEELDLDTISWSDKAKEFKFDNIQDILDHIKESEELIEGFVLKFEDGTRIKIKTADYLELHKQKSGINPLGIWEKLKNDKLSVEDYPDEFHEEIKRVEKNLTDKFTALENSLNLEYETVREIEDDKEFALAVANSDNKGLLFLIRKDKLQKAKELIWDKIRPNNNIID